MMNSNVIVFNFYFSSESRGLNFFKPVNEFVKKGKADNARQVKDQCKHFDRILVKQ